jgi:hypothetical protein
MVLGRPGKQRRTPTTLTATIKAISTYSTGEVEHIYFPVPFFSPLSLHPSPVPIHSRGRRRGASSVVLWPSQAPATPGLPIFVIPCASERHAHHPSLS